MHSKILDFNDLTKLSGYKSKSSVIKWLQKNRIPFLISRSGHPQVLYEVLINTFSNNTDLTNEEWQIEM